MREEGGGGGFAHLQTLPQGLYFRSQQFVVGGHGRILLPQRLQVCHQSLLLLTNLLRVLSQLLVLPKDVLHLQVDGTRSEQMHPGTLAFRIVRSHWEIEGLREGEGHRLPALPKQKTILLINMQQK